MTDPAKRRDVRYASPSEVPKLINTMQFRKLTELKNSLVEVELCKKVVEWNLPIQIGFFVYQYAKLRLLEFHYDFIDKFIDRADHQLLRM